MSSYLRVAEAGFVTFPLLAFVLLVPYMIYEYRRFGSIPAWKSLVVFSMLLYGICAYYMIILPLPESRDAYVAYAAMPNLEPLKFVAEFRAAARIAGLSLAHPSTWLAFLRQGNVYMTLLNVLLTFPVGFYAHYLYGARWWQAALAGFMTSLFFELTQFSGLYGIYAHPYRLFDVDDLIVNTAGAWLGYVCTLPVCALLPNIDDVNARARERGRSYPSITRRLLALAIDLVLAAAVAIGWYLVQRASEGGVDSHSKMLAVTLGVTVALVTLPLVLRGGTFGQRVLRMRVVAIDAAEAPWWRVFARQALAWWGLVLLPCWVLHLYPSYAVEGVSRRGLAVVVFSVWLAWVLLLAVRVLICKLRHQPLVMLNALATGTRLMSLPEIEAVRAAASS